LHDVAEEYTFDAFHFGLGKDQEGSGVKDDSAEEEDPCLGGLPSVGGSGEQANERDDDEDRGGEESGGKCGCRWQGDEGEAASEDEKEQSRPKVRYEGIFGSPDFGGVGGHGDVDAGSTA
jgi:hypothetical protein